jgi:hypothetical protein
MGVARVAEGGCVDSCRSLVCSRYAGAGVLSRCAAARQCSSWRWTSENRCVNRGSAWVCEDGRYSMACMQGSRCSGGVGGRGVVAGRVAEGVCVHLFTTLVRSRHAGKVILGTCIGLHGLWSCVWLDAAGVLQGAHLPAPRQITVAFPSCFNH